MGSSRSCITNVCPLSILVLRSRRVSRVCFHHLQNQLVPLTSSAGARGLQLWSHELAHRASTAAVTKSCCCWYYSFVLGTQELKKPRFRSGALPRFYSQVVEFEEGSIFTWDGLSSSVQPRACRQRVHPKVASR